MANGDIKSVNGNSFSSNPILWTCISAALALGGGNSLYTSQATADRYTRAEATKDQIYVNARIAALEKRVDLLPPKDLKKRIDYLESALRRLELDHARSLK